MALHADDALPRGNDDGAVNESATTETELSLCPPTRALSTFTPLWNAQCGMSTSLTVQGGLDAQQTAPAPGTNAAGPTGYFALSPERQQSGRQRRGRKDNQGLRDVSE